MLDVVFEDDQFDLRKSHAAKITAVERQSTKLRLKKPYNPNYLAIPLKPPNALTWTRCPG
jgi:hypothetical protein